MLCRARAVVLIVFAAGPIGACGQIVVEPAGSTAAAGGGDGGGAAGIGGGAGTGTEGGAAGAGAEAGAGGAGASSGGTAGGGAGGGGCALGTEGCQCVPDGGCEPGLACIDDVCQNPCCTGYQLVDGQCTWVGGPGDPGFMSEGTWSTIGDTTIEPMAAGLDPGKAIFHDVGLCEFGGISQTFSMPETGCGEPLILHYETMYGCEMGICNKVLPRMGVGINGGWNEMEVLVSQQWLSHEMCLGARAFGGQADLFLGPASIWQVCALADGDAIFLDAVGVHPDTSGVCPLPGEVQNGDFEAGPASWTLATNDGVAAIEAGAGKDGSFGARIAAVGSCSSPEIRGQVSIPTAGMMPHAALRFWSSGSAGAQASLQLGEAITRIRGTGQSSVTSICLPAWALGTVQPIELSIETKLAGKNCGTPIADELVFDDLEVVTEPACPEGAALLDPGFEQASVNPALSSWSYWSYPGAAVTAALVVDPTAAHTGNAAAMLSVKEACRGVDVSQPVTVPPPSAQGGPALEFWYRTAPAMPNTKARVEMRRFYIDLPITTEWTQVIACIPPAAAGRPDQVRFSIPPGFGTCPGPYPADEGFWVDDVELGTDPSCP